MWNDNTALLSYDGQIILSKIGVILSLANPSPNIHNINTNIKFGWKPLIFTEVIVRTRKNRRTGPKHCQSWRTLTIFNPKPDIYNSMHIPNLVKFHWYLLELSSRNQIRTEIQRSNVKPNYQTTIDWRVIKRVMSSIQTWCFFVIQYTLSSFISQSILTALSKPLVVFLTAMCSPSIYVLIILFLLIIKKEVSGMKQSLSLADNNWSSGHAQCRPSGVNRHRWLQPPLLKEHALVPKIKDSKLSITQTSMARFPWLILGRFWVPKKFFQ